MSDGPPQEGWWLASDGNWYPPEQRPASPVTEPQPVVPPEPSGSVAPAPEPATSKSNRGCLIALGVLAVLAVLAAGGVVLAVFAIDDAVDEALDDGDVPGLGLLGGDCLRFQAAFATLTFTGFLTSGVDGAQEAEIDEALDDLRQLAPSEIADEIEVVGDAFSEAMGLAISGGLAEGGNADDAEAEAQEILESPEVDQAMERISAWVEDNCS